MAAPALGRRRNVQRQVHPHICLGSNVRVTRTRPWRPVGFWTPVGGGWAAGVPTQVVRATRDDDAHKRFIKWVAPLVRFPFRGLFGRLVGDAECVECTEPGTYLLREVGTVIKQLDPWVPSHLDLITLI